MTPPPKKIYTDREKVMMLLQLCAQMNTAAGRTQLKLKQRNADGGVTLSPQEVHEVLKDMETVLKGAVSFSSMYQKSSAFTGGESAAPATVDQSLKDLTGRVKKLVDDRTRRPSPVAEPPAKPVKTGLDGFLALDGWIGVHTAFEAPLPGLQMTGNQELPWRPAKALNLPVYEEDILQVQVRSLKHYPQGYYATGSQSPKIPSQLYVSKGPQPYLITRSADGFDAYVVLSETWVSFKTLSQTVVGNHIQTLTEQLREILNP